jgi:hypothetical protein
VSVRQMPKVLGSLLKMNGKMHSQFILVYALYAVSRLAGMLHGLRLINTEIPAYLAAADR